MSVDALKKAGLLFAVALVLVLLWRWRPTAYLLGWTVCVYVCYRAWPAVRADYVALHTRFFPARSWRF